MLLNASTANLYDPLLTLHDTLLTGEREILLRLTVAEGFHPGLLQDFLSLVAESSDEFGANIVLEVIDHAGVLQ